MIGRMWKGYTNKQDSDAYIKLLEEEIFTGIAAKNIPGFKGARLMKRELADEFEFITILLFEKIDDIKQLAGNDYHNAYVLPEAQQLLSHYDKQATHYDVVFD